MPGDDLLTDEERDAILRIVVAAEEPPGRLTRAEQIRSDDSRVLRVGHEDRTWIIKRAGMSAGDERLYAPWGFYSEWVGAATVDECGAGVAPTFVGGDGASLLMVFEDVGANQDLSQVLRGSDRDLAVTSLMTMADSLGRLHSATSTPEATDRYLHKWRELCGERQPPILRLPAPRLADAARAALEAASVPATDVPDADLDEVQAWATSSRRGSVLIHGDACLDNWVLDDSGHPRLIDFQAAVFPPRCWTPHMQGRRCLRAGASVGSHSK